MLLYSVRCVIVSMSGAREPVRFDVKIAERYAEQVYDKVRNYVQDNVCCKGEHAENIKLTWVGVM